ncbi:hypothetical protein PUN28_005985 [Cardiocondyla obscurior]|uniref:Uncharacterized protein n=1 Tax=Cardiocondyla obscurior TaxID=286306 RepID=A0AAW2GCL3_9HYME
MFDFFTSISKCPGRVSGKCDVLLRTTTGRATRNDRVHLFFVLVNVSSWSRPR